MGKRAAADEGYRKALAIQEKLVAESPTRPEYSRDTASSYNELGNLLVGIGKLRESEASIKALTIQEKLLRDFPETQRVRKALGETLSNVALLNAITSRQQPEKKSEYGEHAMDLL